MAYCHDRQTFGDSCVKTGAGLMRPEGKVRTGLLPPQEVTGANSPRSTKLKSKYERRLISSWAVCGQLLCEIKEH